MGTRDEKPPKTPRETRSGGGLDTRDVRPGVVLDERYELRKPLGEGGMGRVFIGRDLRLGRDVAVKILHPRIAEDPELVEMFRREAAIMANLRHPNVVAIHDIGGSDAYPYLVMPLHRGADLQAWSAARDGPPVDIDVAVGVMGQACAGAMAMHAAGVVHGDIKPLNILVSESFEVILVDLGMSRYAAAPAPKELGGTPGFLAPELIRRDEVPPELASKADVYALGVTAYWLLTGMMPVGEGEVSAVLLRQLKGDVVRPSEIRPELPSLFDEPIMQALHRKPERRIDATVLRQGLIAARGLCERARRAFVVLVDDDPDLLALIAEVVRDTLHQPEIAALCDPRSALSLIESRPPDLVITDLQMPHLNGMELVAAMRGGQAARSVPLIVVTGVGSGEDWQALAALGVEYCLLKPLSVDLLHDAILRAVARGPNLRR